jgi:hypothetical protein
MCSLLLHHRMNTGRNRVLSENDVHVEAMDIRQG